MTTPTREDVMSASNAELAAWCAEHVLERTEQSTGAPAIHPLVFRVFRRDGKPMQVQVRDNPTWRDFDPAEDRNDAAEVWGALDEAGVQGGAASELCVLLYGELKTTPIISLQWYHMVNAPCPDICRAALIAKLSL